MDDQQPANSLPPDSFAIYLAKNYVGRKGYHIGTVPEAQALLDAGDIVLTYSNGMSFHILCLIDRVANPDRKFPLDAAAIQNVAKVCARYSPVIGNKPQPIGVSVMEIGPASDADRKRLLALKPGSRDAAAAVYVWTIDPQTRAIWSSSLLNGWLSDRRFIQKLLDQPRLSDAELAPAARAFRRGLVKPYLTYTIIGALAAIFGLEMLYPVQPAPAFMTPANTTLLAMGGLSKIFVQEAGEWWRIFSAPLLHAGLLHLAMNALTLFIAGSLLENLIGRVWLGALFVIGAVTGSLMSMSIHGAHAFSIGASGAVMGLIAAGYCLSFRLPPGSPERAEVQTPMLQLLIPAFIPIAIAPGGGQIDWAAHMGGVLGGGLAGFFMLKTWPHADVLPRFRLLAGFVAAFGLCLFLWAGVQVAAHYPSYAAAFRQQE